MARSVDEAWFDASVGDADRRQVIQRALSELPVPQREALVMRIWGGATFPQIAKALGVSSRTVATRFGEALDALGTLLSKDLVQ